MINIFLNELLKNKKVNINKLILYGFIKKEDFLIFRKSLFTNKFDIEIKISNSGDFKSRVIDLEFNDDYELINVNGATGSHLGMIKDLYQNEIKNIINNCYDIEIFKSMQAKMIINYVKDKYNSDLEFLWKKYDDNAICRNSKNKKWYLAMLKISKRKLGFDSDEIVEIIDLKNKPEEVIQLVDNKKFFKGYHMNKKYWYTIILDNNNSIEEIFKLIDISYEQNK